MLRTLFCILLFECCMCTAQAQGPWYADGAEMIEIRHGANCISVFAGIVDKARTGAHSAPKVAGPFEVTVTLAPGCEKGNKFPVASIWPDFAKHLQFEFSSTESGSEAESQRKVLEAKLIETDQPSWEESDATKTLVFRIQEFLSDTSIPVIDVNTEDDHLGQLRVPLHIRRHQHTSKTNSSSTVLEGGQTGGKVLTKRQTIAGITSATPTISGKWQ